MWDGDFSNVNKLRQNDKKIAPPRGRGYLVRRQHLPEQETCDDLLVILIAREVPSGKPLKIKKPIPEKKRFLGECDSKFRFTERTMDPCPGCTHEMP